MSPSEAPRMTEARGTIMSTMTGVHMDKKQSAFMSQVNNRGSNASDTKFRGSSADATMLPFAGGFRLQRMGDYDSSALMGRAYRHWITGVISMKQMKDFPDFCIVDLWTRSRLTGDVNTFAADKFLFRPVPLLYRTWIYHDLFRQRKVVQSADETAMIKYVLQQRCADAPVGAGRWSPIMVYVLSVLACSLTGNLLVVFYGMALVPIFFLIGMLSNSPKYYYYQRLFTLPFRCLWLLLLVLSPQADDNGINTIGYILAVLLGLAECALGDGYQLLHYRLLCNYEIVRELPNRVFICKRNGAALMEEAFGDRGQVDEVISGMGHWQKTYMLLGEVNGILAELRPVKWEEWNACAEDFLDTFEPKLFTGLNVFGKKNASIDELSEPTTEDNVEMTLMNWPKLSYSEEIF